MLENDPAYEPKECPNCDEVLEVFENLDGDMACSNCGYAFQLSFIELPPDCEPDRNLEFGGI